MGKNIENIELQSLPTHFYIVLLIPGRVSETVSYDDCWNRSVEEMKKAIPLAEKLNVNIAIENVWNE